jgi:hypothetical protein
VDELGETPTQAPAFTDEMTLTIKINRDDARSKRQALVHKLMQIALHLNLPGDGDFDYLGRVGIENDEMGQAALRVRSFVVPEGVRLWKCGNGPWTWIAARSEDDAVALYAKESNLNPEDVVEWVDEGDLDMKFFDAPDALSEYPEDIDTVQVRITARELIAEAKEFPCVIMHTGDD